MRGSKIIPLSYASAMEWAEKNLSADKYEEIFGEVFEDDDSTEVLSVSLPSSAADKLRKAAARDGMSVSGKIVELIKSCT